jgi:hypothetical protein
MIQKDCLSSLEYYRQHSCITDPREFAYLYDRLPGDLPALVKIVQGLTLHLLWAKHQSIQVPAERRNEIYLRTVPEMLACLLQMDPAPLLIERPPLKRKVGLCRDYAVLLVSFLRHQGIPARLRVGFAGYFGDTDPKYWDHRIAEYWNAGQNRWMLVDPQIDDFQRSRLGLLFDPLDIDSRSPFLFSGSVWQSCRAGKSDPEQFGDDPQDKGLPPIRYALLHDFDALNEVELVGFDTWHSLIDKPESQVTADERTLLDQIAELTTHVETRFAYLRALYRTTPYSQAVLARLATR